MFGKLIESNRAAEKSSGQSIASVVIHAMVILGAVKATSGATDQLKPPGPDTPIVLLPPTTPSHLPPPERGIPAKPRPPGFQVVTPPTEIPTEIPPVYPGQRFDPRDFTGTGFEGGFGTDPTDGTKPVAIVDAEVFLAGEVDEAPVPMNENGTCNPRFPPVMLSAGIPGKVVVQYIVNTDGHVDSSSLRIVRSSHQAFEEPAREALLGCPFKPGRSHGRPVRVLVQQAIGFRVE
jgi:protein TonB